MRRCVRGGVMAALLAAVLLPVSVVADTEPPALFLTWQTDPTTTMVIDWHTEPGDDPGKLRYRPAESGDWRSDVPERHAFPFSERTIQRVALDGLEPGTEYVFQVGDFSREYRFRTLLERLDGSMTFATGGDTRHTQEMMERTNRVVMEHDPEFIVWGGDLAYADGRSRNAYRWYSWFDAIRNTLITDDGRVVPIVVAIGNHEMRSHEGGLFWYDFDGYEQTDDWRARYAPYFFGLFAFPGQPGYGVLDIGDHTSLVILDSNHANPVTGDQRDWLEATLDEREGRAHVIPFYHVPAYPSVRRYNQRTSREIREQWVTLFDEYRIEIAFENHDHAYKRTPPMRASDYHPRGAIYFGDGAWGVETREVHDPDRVRHLFDARAERHAIIVTLEDEQRHIAVYSEHGELIDELRQELIR
ncbi:purple acid phosphatase family protein [Aquisalimonas asiatica]|uniref:Calcineurin-like phosphoesterase n=1 Tax=Aquisalimonas asiatica TaxID=406100 RepID=A0A1H8U3Y5_9GAMM|nr:metallophosphoesterase family protein [Aquisalimonas asiatica]SEO97992.1 Calcineurin-like phosphoesterase [Aquisalimonas asiatica]